MNETFLVKIADRIIRVQPLTEDLARFCRDYLVMNNSEISADFDVIISEEDIAYEYVLAQKEKNTARNLSAGYLETLVLERKIADRLLEKDTILFHASCISLDGEGICFAAPSGVGKSTHARLWREQFGERIIMINDDKPFLKVTNNGVTAYGSPWNGVHHLGTNRSVPLSEICLLHQDVGNHIKLVSVEDAYPYLMGQTYRPKEEKAVQTLLPLVDALARKVRLFDVGCNMEPEAAQVVSKMILQERQNFDKIN